MAIVPSAAVLSFLMFCRIFIPNFVTSCGLQILFYPTAIGSEPQDPSLNSYPHWTRVMTGHAGANLVCCPYLKLTGICGSLIWLFVHDLSCMQVPLVASNRLGTETFTDSEITFYGGSFIADHKGRHSPTGQNLQFNFDIYEQGQSLAAIQSERPISKSRLAKRLTGSILTLSRNASRAMLWPPLTSRISGGSVRGRCRMLEYPARFYLSTGTVDDDQRKSVAAGASSETGGLTSMTCFSHWMAAPQPPSNSGRGNYNGLSRHVTKALVLTECRQLLCTPL